MQGVSRKKHLSGTVSGRKMLLGMLLFACISFHSLHLHAFDWALTAGPISFFPPAYLGTESSAEQNDGNNQSIQDEAFFSSIFPAGMYGQVGVRAVVHPRVELELQAVPQITPKPFSTAALGVYAGFNLLEDIEGAFFHMLADAGLLYLFSAEEEPLSVDTGSAEPKPLIQIRVSPLSIGNSRYPYRDRLFTVGALYDIRENCFSITWSTWIKNWFF